MTHSPEPWQQGESHEHAADLLDANGKRIAIFNQGFGIKLPDEAPQEPGDANIERAIACVNACAGIPTEDLKGNAIILMKRHPRT